MESATTSSSLPIIRFPSHRFVCLRLSSPLQTGKSMQQITRKWKWKEKEWKGERKKEQVTACDVREWQKRWNQRGNDFVAAFRSRPQWKLGSISCRVINGRAARRGTLNGRRHKVTATTHVRPKSNCENIQCYNMFASTREGGEASRELTILGLARTDQ